MTLRCLACGQRPANTTPEWPALCEPCLDRAGDDIEAGVRVVCTVDETCGGTVDRMVDDGQIAVVRTVTAQEAWVPIQELVRIMS